MKNQNEWCNNCQSRDCECVEPIKYTPPNMNTEGKNVVNRKCLCGRQDIEYCDYNCLTTILPPPSPTAQWQKEAEEMYKIRGQYISETDKDYSDYKNRIGIKREAHIKAREIAHSEHTAHLAQLQGEIDKIGSSIAELLAIYGENIPLKHSEELVSLLTRLRTITQTKMKGE